MKRERIVKYMLKWQKITTQDKLPKDKVIILNLKPEAFKESRWDEFTFIKWDYTLDDPDTGPVEIFTGDWTFRFDHEIREDFLYFFVVNIPGQKGGFEWEKLTTQDKLPKNALLILKRDENFDAFEIMKWDYTDKQNPNEPIEVFEILCDGLGMWFDGHIKGEFTHWAVINYPDEARKNS